MHIGQLALRAKIHFGIPMAIQTPFHIKRPNLHNLNHRANIPMTAITSNTGPQMRRMIKISEIGSLMNAYPFDGRLLVPAISDGIKTRFIQANHAMAIHAYLSSRYIRNRRILDIIVAVSAIHAQVAGVKLMAISNWLPGSKAHFPILRRTEICEKCGHPDNN